MNSNKGSSAITATQQHKQCTIGGNNKQGSTSNVSPYFNNNATTLYGSSKKNATANTRKHTDVSTTPNPSPNRQQLTKKSCHRHGSTQSKYFSSSALNNTLPGSLKDGAGDESIVVVHDSSSLSSKDRHLPCHTSSKICTYDVGDEETTMKSSPVSTPSRRPLGDIGNSPTKLSNSAIRSTTTKSSSLSRQPQPDTELQPFGTTTKTFKPPLILEEEDAHTTFSSIASSITSVGNLPPTLPVAAPTRIIKSRPLHEIEATLKKNGRDLDSEKSMRRQKSAIMISERNTDAPLPDDMNAILYQSKPSNVNKERVIRAKRFDKYLEYSIDNEVFYRGRLGAIDAANAFSELDFTVGYTTIRNRAGKHGFDPSLLGGLIAVKEVIECIFDYQLGFVGTNEREVEASKDMIRHNLQLLKSKSILEYSISDKVFYRGRLGAMDAAKAFAELGLTTSCSAIRRKAGKDGSFPSLLGGRIAVKEVIECIFDDDTGFVGTNKEEVEASKDMIRHNLPRLLANLRKKITPKENKTITPKENVTSVAKAKTLRKAKRVVVSHNGQDSGDQVVIHDGHEYKVGDQVVSDGLQCEILDFTATCHRVKLRGIGGTFTDDISNIKPISCLLEQKEKEKQRQEALTKMQFAVATRTFEPNESESSKLSFQTGDVIMLNLSLAGNGWMMGCKLGEKETVCGWCLLTHLKKFDDESGAKLYAETLTKHDTLPEPLRS